MRGFTKRRALMALAGAVGVAIVAAGCAEADPLNGGENAGGPGVEFGASVEEWQAAFDEAFEDREDIEIVWQQSGAASASNAPRIEAAAARYEEYSNGHVTVELVWSDAIAPLTEATPALQDGRIDLYGLGPNFEPSLYPLGAGILLEAYTTRSPSVVAGTLSNFGAMAETAWETPEYLAEFTDKGLQPINPMWTTAQNVLACREPVVTLDDIRGKQIGVVLLMQATQVEALGGIPVTIAFADRYEALQRGIVDCQIVGPSTLFSFPGMVELTPYITNAEGAAFGAAGATRAFGSRWPELPLVAQQLVFDVHTWYETEDLGPTLSSILRDLHTAAIEAGGAFLELDDAATDRLAEVAEETVAGWGESELLDGEAFGERLAANREKWDALVAEAGYSEASFSDVYGWLADSLDIEPSRRLYYEHILIPNRPR